MYRCASIFIAIVLLVSCSNTEKPETAITIDPLPFQAGAVTTITYDASHPLARFTDGEDMFVTVMITGGTSHGFYRLAMTKEESIYTAAYTIPDDATNILFYVSPDDEYQDAHHADGVVYSGDHPAEHSLFVEIRNTDIQEKAQYHFEEDAKLYPESTDRYTAYWMARLLHRGDTASIVHEADSLFLAATGKYSERSSRIDMNTQTAFLGCGMVYAASGDLDRAFQAVRAFNDSYTGIPLLCAQSNAMHQIWSTISDMAVNGTPEQEIVRKHLIEQCVQIALKSKSIHLLTRVMEAGDTPFRKQRGAVSELKEIITSEQYLPRFADAVCSIQFNDLVGEDNLIMRTQDLYMENNDPETCIRVSEYALSAMDSSMLWVRSDPTKHVDIMPPTGIEAAIRFQLAKAYIRTGRVAEAHDIMKNLIMRSHHHYRSYQMRQSGNELATYYASISERDSAAKYLGYAMQLVGPESEDRYDEIKSMLHGDFPDRATLLKKYYRRDLAALFPCPDFEFSTQSNTYKLGKDFSGELILLFSSRTCGICHIEIPRTIRELQESGKSIPKIIIFSDESPEEIKRYVKNVDVSNIEFASIDSKFTRKLHIHGTPCHAVIKNGDVVSIGGVGEMTHFIILHALQG